MCVCVREREKERERERGVERVFACAHIVYLALSAVVYFPSK